MPLHLPLRWIFIPAISLVFFFTNSSSVHATNFTSSGLRLTKTVKPLNVIKKQNVVTQSLDFSCGAAGLSTLLNYYLSDPTSEIKIIETLLQHVPEEKVRARRGFSLLDLKSFAQAKGYNAVGYQMTAEDLRNLGKPVLVPIKFRNFRHFVVVRGVIGDRVFIADPSPAAGNISMKVEQFQNIWIDGIALLVDHPQSAENQGRPRLKLTEEDLMFVDYKLMTRLTNSAMIRSSVFSGEF